MKSTVGGAIATTVVNAARSVAGSIAGYLAQALLPGTGLPILLLLLRL